MMLLSQREYKKLLILNLINSKKGISRTEIANMTDYRASTIGELVNELLDEKIIVESGKSQAGQGRKRKMLEVNGDYLCAVGVVIYPPKIDVLICSISGEIWKRITIPFEKNWSADKIIETLSQNIRALASEFEMKKIIGVGICDPGVVAANHEYSLSSVYINNWKNVHIKSIVEDMTKLPVSISSRVYLTALAEQSVGRAKGKNDFICLVLSEGIGLSFVCNGRVVTGYTGMAGQIGHTCVCKCDKEVPCYCGNFGCMETECSFPAIKKKIAGALISGYSSNLSVFKDSPNKITPVDIRSAIEDGDRLVINVVKSAARNIGLALANCINILNPESIIMSGEMIEFGDPFISTIVDSAKEHIIPIQNISIEFAISDLMDTALPLGAASVVFSEFLQTETFKGICDIS